MNRIGVRPLDAAAASPLSIVRSYPDLPMEEVFPRPGATKEPAVFAREAGRGRVVYFPFDLDRTFWDVLNADHLVLLRNAVLWATNEPAPVSVKGPGVLDLAIWQQKNSMTVHLVNLTNPMMMKGPIREIIPVLRQQVQIRIPGAQSITAVRLLVAGRAVPYRRTGETITLEVPSISLHEVIAVDFRTG
ncbi:MAG: hypothetical protein JO211_14990 [Acidobacteriaceae bacterium]|nr:hypothetical protein [Acidobacteriaceae bacterium]